MTEETAQETLQPLYLLCDGSMRMRDQDLAVANLLVGHLADEITGDPLLAWSTRWGIELYDSGDRTTTLMQLQQVDLVTWIPQMVTTIEEPTLGTALLALRRRISGDVAMLEADAADVRSPLVAVLTSGFSLDGEEDRATELAALLTVNPFDDPDRAWTPMVLLITPPESDQTIAKAMAADRGDVDLAVLGSLDDVADLARWIARALRQSVEYGVSRLRYAQWVVSEHGLDQLTGVPRPFVLHRFDDLGDADAHPFGDLLDVVALRGDPAAAGLNGRFRWPYRLVVGDDPGTAVGLLLPAVPDRFTAVDGHGGRAPRPMSALRLDRPVPPVPAPDVPAPADGVLRARLCAALADTVHLAHQRGVVLGEQALASALYTAGPDPEVLLADCTGVRLHGPGGRDRQAADLTWLGRFVDRCASRPETSGATPFLDAAGQELLRRVRSNVAHLLPAAAEWRDYLTGRVVALQGPPVIEQVQVSPEIVPVGSPVTVRWRGRYAEQLVITGPDGTRVDIAENELDEGHTQLIMTRAGPIRLRAANLVGGHRAETGHVHVFDLPRLPEVRLPELPPEPAATRTDHWDSLLTRYDRRTLPAFPPVAVPAPPSGVLRVTGFPIDVARWFDARPERPRRRWPRWLRKPWA